jgi:hypothetical protein
MSENSIVIYSIWNTTRKDDWLDRVIDRDEKSEPMYFWDIDALKEDLSNNEVNEEHKFIYAFIYIIIASVNYEAHPYYSLNVMNLWNIIAAVSSVIIVTVGTLYAYKVNGGNAGEDFLGRYFSIGFAATRSSWPPMAAAPTPTTRPPRTRWTSSTPSPNRDNKAA